ncbi:MAG: lipopolysaccharide transport periplasmic protein LptA [Gammaproteobacteria bacterium]|jgi:lipopolysaccharide export system protein LptA|nr:lipopolysaccharide transport periplasmic protein LptA [Gammaproteobacteria bacterium]
MLAALLLATAAAAQTGERVGIRAENASFDNERGATHLRDNVRITRGELEIEADEGFVYRGEDGLRQIELFGTPVRWRTVTEAGGETTGQANEVVYDVLSRTVTLIGDARIQEQRGSFSGDQLVYNIDTQATEGQGGIRMEIEPETIDSDGDDAPDPD